MKKKIFFTIINLLILSTIIFNGAKFSNNELTLYAENQNQSVALIGKSEIYAKADEMKINFSIQTRADNIVEGQNKVMKILDDLKSKVSKIDSNSNVFVNYSSCYSVSDGGILGYEFNYNISVKSQMLDKLNDIILASGEAGITNFYNVNYSIKNYEDLYFEALNKAKENAINKAKSLYSNIELKKITEKASYVCHESEGENVKISAQILANFNLSNEIIEKNENLDKELVKNDSNVNVLEEKEIENENLKDNISFKDTKDIKEKDVHIYEDNKESLNNN